jgi:hypothetical protein
MRLVRGGLRRLGLDLRRIDTDHITILARGDDPGLTA